jgi:hypothetical protein
MDTSQPLYHGNLKAIYPANEETLHPAPIGVKLKNILAMTGIAVVLVGIGFGINHETERSWPLWVGGILGGLVFLGGLFMGLSAKVADCPYCKRVLGKGTFAVISSLDENQMVECSHCYELLLSHAAKIRAYTVADAGDKTSFEAPVFLQGVWPGECIACGKPTTHYEEAKKVKVELERLLVGTLSVASGSVRGIPYCAEHTDMIKLTIKDDYPRLTFPNLDMRKRYTLVNQQKTMHVMKIRKK